LEKEESYLAFLKLCAELMEEHYLGEVTAEICSTTKNNGVRQTGLLLKRRDERIAPNFYLGAQYREWEAGRSSPDEIVFGICRVYEEELKKNRKLAEAVDFSWESAKEKVFVRLVGRQKNETLLEELPHEEFLDMAVVYHYVIELAKNEKGALVITKEHLQLFDITEEELRETALKNTMEQMCPVITGMNEMMQRLANRIGVSVPFMQTEGMMYIMGNKEERYGATSLLFSKELERFSNEIGSGFYILPSSIHEIILVPEDYAESPEAFSDMVHEVNATQLDPTEVLTDSVYYYDRELHLVRRVA